MYTLQFASDDIYTPLMLTLSDQVYLTKDNYKQADGLLENIRTQYISLINIEEDIMLEDPITTYAIIFYKRRPVVDDKFIAKFATILDILGAPTKDNYDILVEYLNKNNTNLLDVLEYNLSKPDSKGVIKKMILYCQYNQPLLCNINFKHYEYIVFTAAIKHIRLNETLLREIYERLGDGIKSIVRPKVIKQMEFIMNNKDDYTRRNFLTLSEFI